MIFSVPGFGQLEQITTADVARELARRGIYEITPVVTVATPPVLPATPPVAPEEAVVVVPTPAETPTYYEPYIPYYPLLTPVTPVEEEVVPYVPAAEPEPEKKPIPREAIIVGGIALVALALFGAKKPAAARRTPAEEYSPEEEVAV